MRKRLINQDPQSVSGTEPGWVDLEHLAEVEITSEDAAYPIEAALTRRIGAGWRATERGKQTIRLLFNQVQRIRRIQVVFYEQQRVRTQEFVLRWSQDGGQSYREILRQQYNFSPPTVAQELEDYAVDLGGVTTLELTIVPDISGGDARASLAQLRIAS